MPTAKDLLQSAITGDALGFTDMYNEIMDGKVSEAIEAKRIEIAQAIYGDEVAEEVEDLEDEVVSESEEELDDIDLDLEDLEIDEEELDANLGEDEDDQEDA